MGHLYYSNAVDPIELPDRLLAHIKVIVGTKLQPAIPLRFVFDSAEPEKLNQPVLKHMAEMANSSAGLTVDVDDEIPSVTETPAPAQMRPAARRTPVRARTTVAA